MRVLIVVLAAVILPASVRAQASQFGVNGLGMPGRALSVRAIAGGGAFGLFDAASTLNPATIGDLPRLTASFSVLQSYRTSSNSRESLSGRDTRFPLFSVAGPVPGSALSLGASFSGYTDRDFAVASTDTLLLRGVEVATFDTLTSTGGISDLRFTGAWRGGRWTIGAGMHLITGSARVALRREFSDTTFAGVAQRAEITYSGLGVSVGGTALITPALAGGAFVRLDGSVRIDRDSVEAGSVSLPVSIGASLRWRPTQRLDLAAMTVLRNWSSASDEIVALGGTGADNTFELAAGGEWIRSRRQPARLPLRFGVHYRSLPFPVENGAQPAETGVSVGTGLAFAREGQTGLPRAGVDLSLSHLWRSAEGGYDESVWMIGLGIAVRP